MKAVSTKVPTMSAITFSPSVDSQRATFLLASGLSDWGISWVRVARRTYGARHKFSMANWRVRRKGRVKIGRVRGQAGISGVFSDAISDARLGQNDAGIVGIVLDLLPQMADVDPQILRV